MFAGNAAKSWGLTLMFLTVKVCLFVDADPVREIYKRYERRDLI